jgi:hypothetical protein
MSDDGIANIKSKDGLFWEWFINISKSLIK